MTRDDRLIAALVIALERANTHIEQLGCTCVNDYNQNHIVRRRGSPCTGVGLAQDAEPVLKRAKKRLEKVA